MLFGKRDEPIAPGVEVIPREKMDAAYQEYRRLLNEVIEAGELLDRLYLPLAAGRYTADEIAGREAELAQAFAAMARAPWYGPIPLLRDQIARVQDAGMMVAQALWEQNARREKQEREDAAIVAAHQAELAEAQAAADRLNRALARQG